MNEGLLFDLQRGSMVDGDGIRTAVFLKGCSLRCFWCHNPESQGFYAQCLFDQSKCAGCGRCAAVCPQNACAGFAVERALCIGCGKCADACPSGAKTLCGEKMGVDELYAKIERDRAFYRASGGGVTFTGGEPLLQPVFLKEICKKCGENAIHVAVDTAGFVPWENFEAVLPYTDVFLFDIKAVTETLHREGTGFSNRLILENLRMLDARGKKIQLRVPVIPGFNDSCEEMSKISDFIAGLRSACRVELLPYHTLGVKKYELLGRHCEKLPLIDEKQLQVLKSIFYKKGI